MRALMHRPSGGRHHGLDRRPAIIPKRFRTGKGHYHRGVGLKQQQRAVGGEREIDAGEGGAFGLDARSVGGASVYAFIDDVTNQPDGHQAVVSAADGPKGAGRRRSESLHL